MHSGWKNEVFFTPRMKKEKKNYPDIFKGKKMCFPRGIQENYNILGERGGNLSIAWVYQYFG